MAVEISQNPWATLPLSLHVHSTQPGLCTCGAVHHHKHTTAVSSSSHEGKDGFFLCGKWAKQCRELAVWPKPREESVLDYSFEGSHPWPSNRGLTTLVPLTLLLLNSWLGTEPVAAWTRLAVLWTYSSSCRLEWDLHNWQWWWFLQAFLALVSLWDRLLLCHLELVTDCEWAEHFISTYPLRQRNKAILHLCRYCKSFRGCRVDPVSSVDTMCVLMPRTPTKAALQFLFIWLAL